MLEATERCPPTAVEKADLPRRGALEVDTNVRRILVADAAMVPLLCFEAGSPARVVLFRGHRKPRWGAGALGGLSSLL